MKLAVFRVKMRFLPTLALMVFLTASFSKADGQIHVDSIPTKPIQTPGLIVTHPMNDPECSQNRNQIIESFVNKNYPVVFLLRTRDFIDPSERFGKDPSFLRLQEKKGICAYMSGDGSNRIDLEFPEVTLVGGYWGSCLERTMNSITWRYFQKKKAPLTFHLPMRAIYVFDWNSRKTLYDVYSKQKNHQDLFLKEIIPHMALKKYGTLRGSTGTLLEGQPAGAAVNTSRYQFQFYVDGVEQHNQRIGKGSRIIQFKFWSDYKAPSKDVRFEGDWKSDSQDLARALQNKEKMSGLMKKAALTLLGRSDDLDAEIKKAFQSNDWQIKTDAIFAMTFGIQRDELKLEDHLLGLKKVAIDSSPELFPVVLAMPLIYSGDKGYMTALKWANDQNLLIRKTAYSALTDMGNKGMVKLLDLLKKSQEPEVILDIVVGGRASSIQPFVPKILKYAQENPHFSPENRHYLSYIRARFQ